MFNTLKQIFKNHARMYFIEFLNGGPLEDEMTDAEIEEAMRRDAEGCDDPDAAEGMTPVQQLQVEEALKTLEMQVPIYITRAIDDKLFDETITRLHDILFLRQRVKALQKRYPDDKMIKLVELDKPIKVIISTPGGLVRESLALYDTIQMLKKDGAIVETIGCGKVMSAGTLLLSSGSEGHRYVTENTTLMIHDMSGGAGGTWPSVENQYEEMKRLRAQYMKLFKENTKLTKKQLENMLDEKVDQYIGVSDTIKYGVADHII